MTYTDVKIVAVLIVGWFAYCYSVSAPQKIEEYEKYLNEGGPIALFELPTIISRGKAVSNIGKERIANATRRRLVSPKIRRRIAFNEFTFGFFGFSTLNDVVYFVFKDMKPDSKCDGTKGDCRLG